MVLIFEFWFVNALLSSQSSICIFSEHLAILIICTDFHRLMESSFWLYYGYFSIWL